MSELVLNRARRTYDRHNNNSHTRTNANTKAHTNHMRSDPPPGVFEGATGVHFLSSTTIVNNVEGKLIESRMFKPGSYNFGPQRNPLNHTLGHDSESERILDINSGATS